MFSFHRNICMFYVHVNMCVFIRSRNGEFMLAYATREINIVSQCKSCSVIHHRRLKSMEEKLLNSLYLLFTYCFLHQILFEKCIKIHNSTCFHCYSHNKDFTNKTLHFSSVVERIPTA